MHRSISIAAIALGMAAACGASAQNISQEEVKATVGQPAHADEPVGGTSNVNELQDPQNPAADKDSRVEASANQQSGSSSSEPRQDQQQQQ
jgi:hypothetical protein